MNAFKSTSLLWCVLGLSLVALRAQTNHALNNLTTFGPNGDGSVRPADRIYLTSTTGNAASENLERGIAYNAVTDHLLIVSRTNNTPAQVRGIYILDAATGADIGGTPTSMNFTGITGTNDPSGFLASGNFILQKIAVADDGVIYAANFGTFGNSVNGLVVSNTVYRWSDENAAPTVAFRGDPSAGTTNRSWGTTLDVRGAGTNTQILLGSGNGTVASILTTADGTNFTANVINTDVLPGDLEHGCVFGHGNTFWSKAVNRALRLLSFDLITSNATTIRAYNTNAMPASLTLGQMAFDPGRNILAFLDVAPGTDHVRLYDMSNTNIPPVLLDVKDFSVDNANVNNAGALDFAADRLFVLDCNNGIQTFTISSNAMSAPAVISGPASQQVPVNLNAYFDVFALRGVTYQWQHEGTNIPGATNISLVITNVQLTDGGDYQVLVGNSASTVPSPTATLTIIFPDDATHLNPLWSLAPQSRGYLPVDTDVALGRTPFYRSVAYNPLSNQVYIISRNQNAQTGLMISVLDATTGADMYKLSTNGIAPVSPSANSIILNMGAVAEDGAIYAGNMAYGGGSTPAGYRLYRWANSASNTNPTLVFSGEPAGSASVLRWGDTMVARGAGTNTQIMIDQASNLVMFRPTNETMTGFSPKVWAISNATASQVGRTVQFGSATNEVWLKRYGFNLFDSSFDFAESLTTFLYLNSSVPPLAGQLAFDFSNHLMAVILYSFNSSVPDSLDLYDVADIDNPVLLGSYPFPTTSKPNSTGIGQVVFSNSRVYAVNGNNGVMGFSVAFRVIPRLDIAQSGSTVLLSWTNSVSGYTLQCNTNLSSTNWMSVNNPVSVSDRRYVVSDLLTDGTKFYRLIK
jgi:hypothetical protein